MKIAVWPKTKLGKWSIGFMIYAFVAFATMEVLVLLGERGGDTFFSNLKLGLSGLSVALSSILAFVAGVLGIFHSKERSVLVFLAVFIGLQVLVLVAGEILVPH